MKIHQFKAENVKRLSVVEITPTDKGVVVIAGRNGQGKSSVLDAIQMALGGADGIPSKAVRRGEDKARIDIDLGEIQVTRTITADGGGQLVVRDKDGERQKSPQEILDKLYGRLSFDPLEFRRQKPAERSTTLRALLGLCFDTEDQQIKVHYDERTIVNRELKAVEARLHATEEYPDAPKEEQSTRAIMEEQNKAIAINNANAEIRRECDQGKNYCVELEAALNKRKEAIFRMEQNLAAEKQDFAKAEAELEAARSKHQALIRKAEKLQDIDREPFLERARQVEEINIQVRANKTKSDLRTVLKAKTKASDDLTSKIEALEKQKRQRIIQAKFPVEGLSLSDTKEVMFNGIPFDQCSTAEQLRVSVAMGLAMNPKLRVLLIRQGNDLDSDNLKLVAELADKFDSQVWIERIEEGEATVVIEDGRIKTIDQKSTASEQRVRELEQQEG